ncbi:hypothetical protein UYSO10_3443 [Kosakonia radicincitans]|nr:hypothetical protein UYSO10_3443 [Kosakonia radicincitans]
MDLNTHLSDLRSNIALQAKNGNCYFQAPAGRMHAVYSLRACAGASFQKV